jgi:hypothetical protein
MAQIGIGHLQALSKATLKLSQLLKPPIKHRFTMP